MHRVIRFCCRCAPDRGQATLLQGIRGVIRFCVERTSRGSVACPAIGDAVVVTSGYAICLMHRVIRCCCRCAPDRGQATLLQGMCGVVRFCVERRICGSELARDRRRSRRKPGLSDLPDAPRHPILLPLRARSRASHAPTRIYGVAGFCVERRICGSELARDRRRSRRKPGLGDLPEVPRHTILLPLRARSRASHAPTR